MDEALLQLGVGGIFSILILREVFGFIKGADNKEHRGKCHCGKEIKEIKEELNKNHEDHDKSIDEILIKTRELWHWHSQEDPETGIKSWYTSTVKSKLNELIKLLKKENGS
jgi:hypothetical protein